MRSTAYVCASIFSLGACAAELREIAPDVLRAIESKCGVQDVATLGSNGGPPSVGFTVRIGSGREATAYDCVANELKPYSYKGLVEAQVPADYKKPSK